MLVLPRQVKIKNKSYDYGLLIFCSLFLIFKLAYADKLSFEQLFKHIEVPAAHKLFYTEKRYSLFLKQPLESSGYIKFIEPDRLIKQVLLPHKKRFQITVNEISIESETGKIIKLNVQDNPQFIIIKQLYSSLLTGNTAVLKSYFSHEVFPLSENKIRLRLTPRLKDGFIEYTGQHSSVTIDILLTANVKNNKKLKIQQIILSGVTGERSEMFFEIPAEKQP